MSTLTIDEYRALIEASKVKCEICLYAGHSLVEHLQLKHNMSAGQYKKTYPAAKLASPLVTELIKRMSRRQPGSVSLEKHAEIFLLKTPVQKDMLADLASKLVPVPAHLKEFIPERNPHFEFGEEATTIAYAYLNHKNCLVMGPTGCGKTELIMQAFAAMGRPIRRVNMHGDVTAATFVGSSEANTQGTYFKEGVLPWCMENGVPILVDEYDYTPPSIASQLNPVMDRGRMLFIAEANKIYTAKGDFTIFLTGNTAGKGDSTGVYTGTEIMNTAFLNRIPLVEKMDFLPEAKEIELLGTMFTKIDRTTISRLVKAANEVRVAFKQGTLSICYSTRNLIDVAEAIPTFGVEKSIKKVMLNWLDADDLTLVMGLFTRVGIQIK